MKDDRTIRILVIDDEGDHAEATAESLRRRGYHCLTAASGKEGIDILESEPVDLVITDLVMPEVAGMDVLAAAKGKDRDIEVIVMTGYASVETAVEAMQKGAATYLKKPLNIQEVRTVVEKVLEKQSLSRENLALHRALDRRYGFEGIIGNTLQVARVMDTVRHIAETSATVIIFGESGTGKDLLARAIHRNSPRRNNHFVPLNCAALSEGILESELFGHEKGAFTGAMTARKGRFEFANRGTLFLDEIGDLPTTTQVKLLRVIETGEITRVGSNQTIHVDVRLVAATNRDLDELVREGKFREDLYFRLKVVTLYLPPLRERRADIPLLVDEFVREFSDLHRKPIREVTSAVRAVFQDHDWPGNIRELRNCIESMVVTTRDDILDLDDIPMYIARTQPTSSGFRGGTMEEMERRLIEETMRSVSGNRKEAARLLEIGERTLYRKIQKFALGSDKGREEIRSGG